MKNKEAFEKWWAKYEWVSPKTDMNTVRAWEACEDFYENKKCEDCEHFYFATFPNKASSFICSKINSFEVFSDFCCRHWQERKVENE